MATTKKSPAMVTIDTLIHGHESKVVQKGLDDDGQSAVCLTKCLVAFRKDGSVIVMPFGEPASALAQKSAFNRRLREMIWKARKKARLPDAARVFIPRAASGFSQGEVKVIRKQIAEYMAWR